MASDSTAAILYRNNHDGTFTDRALASGTAFSENGMAQAGMGLAVGDVNADGRFDILKTHFADDVPALYRGLGSGLYEDIATLAGLAVQNRYVQWGAGMPDLDADGRQDLVYVTGNVYPEIEARLPEYPHKSPMVIFRNLDDRRFEDVTARSGPGARVPRSSRGAAFGDVDNDGDVDVVVNDLDGAPQLLRNDGGNAKSSILVKLVGAKSNRDGIGARVRVVAGDLKQVDEVRSGGSYLSQNDLRLHFGLDGRAKVDAIEVRWPSGAVDTVPGAAANRILTIAEGKGLVDQREYSPRHQSRSR